jgi:hypothetical protein
MISFKPGMAVSSLGIHGLYQVADRVIPFESGVNIIIPVMQSESGLKRACRGMAQSFAVRTVTVQTQFHIHGHRSVDYGQPVVSAQTVGYLVTDIIIPGYTVENLQARKGGISQGIEIVLIGDVLRLGYENQGEVFGFVKQGHIPRKAVGIGMGRDTAYERLG